MAELSASVAEFETEADPEPSAAPAYAGAAGWVKPPHRGFVPRAAAVEAAVAPEPEASAADDGLSWGEPVDAPPPIIEPLFIGFESEPFEAPQPELVHTAAEIYDPEPSAAGELAGPLADALASEPEPELYAESAPGAEPEPAWEPEPEIAEESAPARRTAADAAQVLDEVSVPWWREPQDGARAIPAVARAEAGLPPLPAEVGRQAAQRQVRRPRSARFGRAAVVVAAIGVGALGGALYSHFSSPPRRAVTLAPLPEAPHDPAKRLAFYETRAKAGDAEAQLELAILYAKGEGVPQSYATAATWFRAAAQQGVPRAQYDLGVLYERGRGVPVDYGKAFAWYRLSAESNFPLAQYNLAVAYTRGQGTKADLTAAAGWYRRAAIQGAVPAMVNLAILYERGQGVSASTIEAYAWYRAAASRGNRPSAKRAAELFAVLTHPDQAKAEARAATVIASLPAATPEEAAAAAVVSGPPPTLKSGIEPDAEEEGDAGPASAKQQAASTGQR